MPDGGSDFLSRMGGIGALGATAALQQGQGQRLKMLEQQTKAATSPAAGPAGAEKTHTGAIEKAATQFEALLLHEMLKSMWSTVPQNGMLSGSHEESLYRDMLNEAVATSISEHQSIGVKDVVARDMEQQERRKAQSK